MVGPSASQAAWSSHLLFLGAMEPLLEELLHRADRQGAPAHEPLAVLLDRHTRGQTNQPSVVGEDSDDVGPSADLAVDPFERVRIPYERRQMPPVTHDRPDAEASRPVSTVRPSGTGASGSKRRSGRPFIGSMGFEPALVLGRPCDSPGCAASANP